MSFIRRVWGRAPAAPWTAAGTGTVLPARDAAGMAWAGELWTDRPVRAPRRVDVAAFLAQRPLPYLWPDDDVHRERVDRDRGRATRVLTLSWLYVLLHHRDPQVVIDALRHPALVGVPLDTAIAELLARHPEEGVRDEALRAVWRLPDDEVRLVVRGLCDDPGVRASRSTVVRRVAAAHPASRARLAAELGASARSRSTPCPACGAEGARAGHRFVVACPECETATTLTQGDLVPARTAVLCCPHCRHSIRLPLTMWCPGCAVNVRRDGLDEAIVEANQPAEEAAAEVGEPAVAQAS